MSTIRRYEPLCLTRRNDKNNSAATFQPNQTTVFAVRSNASLGAVSYPISLETLSAFLFVLLFSLMCPLLPFMATQSPHPILIVGPLEKHFNESCAVLTMQIFLPPSSMGESAAIEWSAGRRCEHMRYADRDTLFTQLHNESLSPRLKPQR